MEKMEFTVRIEVHPAQLTLLRLSCTKAHLFDSKVPSDAGAEYSVKAFK